MDLIPADYAEPSTGAMGTKCQLIKAYLRLGAVWRGGLYRFYDFNTRTVLLMLGTTCGLSGRAPKIYRRATRVTRGLGDRAITRHRRNIGHWGGALALIRGLAWRRCLYRACGPG